jgi:hypothetical protein
MTMWGFATVCKDCLIFNGFVLCSFYGVLVLVAGVMPFKLVGGPGQRKAPVSTRNDAASCRHLLVSVDP